MNALLNHALDYASAGYSVLPIKTGAKKPDLKSWTRWKTERADAAQLKNWFARNGRNPEALGIVCGDVSGGLCIIDFDGRNWRTAYDEFMAKFPKLAKSRTVQTGSGKRHVWLKVRDLSDPNHKTGRLALKETGDDVKNVLGLGIELRANGHQTLVPPSKHPGGGRYQFVDPFAPIIELDDWHELADWIEQWEQRAQGQRASSPFVNPPTQAMSEDERRERYGQRALADEIAELAAAKPGTRNRALFNAACSLFELVNSGILDEDTVIKSLEAACHANGLVNDDGLQSVLDTIASARKTTAGKMRQMPNPNTSTGQQQRQRQGARQSQPGGRRTGAQQAPKRRRGRPRKYKLLTADYISLYNQWNYGARLNRASADVEVNGKPFDDVLKAKIQARVRDYGTTKDVSVNVTHAIESLVTLADQRGYHPVKDYLESLAWDGSDHIDALCGYFEDDRGQFPKWFRHWLVGSVAKVYGGFQNPMLVLDAGQDAGKSYFARWLCPMGDYFNASAIVPDNKDHKLRLIRSWIWEVEELGATTRRADVEALKAFITLETVRERKSYGRNDTIKPALSSFIGTLNNDSGFLVDRTGNRRFLVCTLTGIDWDYSQDVDRDQLWAQALDIYRSGGQWQLSKQDRQSRDDTNAQYMVDDPVEAYLHDQYEFTGDANDTVSLPQILSGLSTYKVNPTKATTMTVASILKSWGATKERPRIDGVKTVTYRGVKSVTLPPTPPP